MKPTGAHTLADALERRCAQLRLSWKELAELAGISTETLWRVRHGKGASARTLSRIEEALQWEPGSLDAIARGGKPIPMGRAQPTSREALIEDILEGIEELKDKLKKLQDEPGPHHRQTFAG